MSKSLFEKVWDAHSVRTLADGQTQLLAGLWNECVELTRDLMADTPRLNTIIRERFT